MPGIVSFGAYVPRYRMPKMTVYMNMGWFNPVTMSVAKGEKAVANVDQDSITMAVDSAVSCMGADEGKDIDALYFASTTMPYKERLNSGIVAAALDLSASVRAADFGGGLKAGTSAVIAALEAAAAGKKVMVSSADNRLGKPGSMQEMLFGDGAASLLIGNENVIAEYVDSFSVTYDFADHIRREDAVFDRTWEE
ncbi:MAG: short-chain dehydrogenase, partial [bacterium]